MVKNPPATQEVQETRVPSLGREDLLEEGTAPTPVLLPGGSHGPRSLVGPSPWGRRQSHTTERLSMRAHTVSGGRGGWRGGWVEGVWWVCGGWRGGWWVVVGGGVGRGVSGWWTSLSARP